MARPGAVVRSSASLRDSKPKPNTASFFNVAIEICAPFCASRVNVRVFQSPAENVKSQTPEVGVNVAGDFIRSIVEFESSGVAPPTQPAALSSPFYQGLNRRQVSPLNLDTLKSRTGKHQSSNASHPTLGARWAAPLKTISSPKSETLAVYLVPSHSC